MASKKISELVEYPHPITQDNDHLMAPIYVNSENGNKNYQVEIYSKNDIDSQLSKIKLPENNLDDIISRLNKIENNTAKILNWIGLSEDYIPEISGADSKISKLIKWIWGENDPEKSLNSDSDTFINNLKLWLGNNLIKIEDIALENGAVQRLKELCEWSNLPSEGNWNMGAEDRLIALENRKAPIPPIWKNLSQLENYTWLVKQSNPNLLFKKRNANAIGEIYDWTAGDEGLSMYNPKRYMEDRNAARNPACRFNQNGWLWIFCDRYKGEAQCWLREAENHASWMNTKTINLGDYCADGGRDRCTLLIPVKKDDILYFSWFYGYIGFIPDDPNDKIKRKEWIGDGKWDEIYGDKN